MGQLRCEVCGGTELTKQEGVFVCQTCGARYSLEEARNMLFGNGGGSAPAPVQADNAAQVQNLTDMAWNAYRSGNAQEAERYANRVLELDPKNPDAWFVKGAAAGWQSTLAHIRFTESVECWGKAVECVDEARADGMKQQIGAEMTNLAKALITKRADMFAGYPSEENFKALLNDKLTIALHFLSLGVKLGQFTDADELNDFMASTIRAAAMKAYEAANRAYGPEDSDRNKFAYRVWMEKTTCCIAALENAFKDATSEATLNLCYENLRVLQNAMINSRSYKFVAYGYASGYEVDTRLTQEAISLREQELRKYDADLKRRRAEIQEKRRKIEEQAAAEQAERNRAYWEAHADEKAELERKRDALRREYDGKCDELQAMRTELDAVRKRLGDLVPAHSEEEQTAKAIRSLKERISKLGFFQGREKKSLTEQLRAEEAKMLEIPKKIKAQREAREAELQPQIDAWKKRMEPKRARCQQIKEELDAIQEELTKPR